MPVLAALLVCGIVAIQLTIWTVLAFIVLWLVDAIFGTSILGMTGGLL